MRLEDPDPVLYCDQTVVRLEVCRGCVVLGLEIAVDSKVLFVRAIEELLADRDLESVTVGDIVARAGLSKSNFYNHFTDKYDLVNWRHSLIHDRRMEDFMAGRATYREMVRSSLDGIADYRTLYRHSLKRDGYETLRRHIERLSFDGSRRIFAGAGVDMGDRAIGILIEMHSTASCELMFRWIRGELDMTSDEVSLLIERSLCAELAETLSSYEARGGGATVTARSCS